MPILRDKLLSTSDLNDIELLREVANIVDRSEYAVFKDLSKELGLSEIDRRYSLFFTTGILIKSLRIELEKCYNLLINLPG